MATNQNNDYRCQLCHDSGLILDKETKTAEQCTCIAKRKRERLFANSKITPAFKSKTLKNFSTNNRPDVVGKMLEAATTYTDNFDSLGENNWLVLLGESGSGKTHLSMAVANYLLNKGIPILYFPHLEGFNELRDTFNKNREDTFEEHMQQLRKIGVLVWDDLFKGSKDVKDFEIKTTYDILNYRYLNLLPTIISSELTPVQLLSIDKAIGGRIIERSKGHMVTVEDRKANFRLGG